MRSYWEAYPSLKSEAIVSNSYFVGIMVGSFVVLLRDNLRQLTTTFTEPLTQSIITTCTLSKIEPNQLTISEMDDTPQQITLKSTLPITCKDPDHMGRCEISVRVVTPERLVTGSGILPAYLQCMSRYVQTLFEDAPHTLSRN